MALLLFLWRLFTGRRPLHLFVVFIPQHTVIPSRAKDESIFSGFPQEIVLFDGLHGREDIGFPFVGSRCLLCPIKPVIQDQPIFHKLIYLIL